MQDDLSTLGSLTKWMKRMPHKVNGMRYMISAARIKCDEEITQSAWQLNGAVIAQCYSKPFMKWDKESEN